MKAYLFCVFIVLFCFSYGQSKTTPPQLKKVDKSTITTYHPMTPVHPAPAQPTTPAWQGTLTTNGKKNSSPSTPKNVIPINKIIVTNDGGQAVSVCSAMRITPTLILTEAHCLAKEPPDDWTGYAHNERIHVMPVLQQDGLWRADLSAATNKSISQPNAQVMFYRPNYVADGSKMSYAFDLALIKLDSALKLNNSVLQQESSKLSLLPQEIQEQMLSSLQQTINQEFAKQKKTYEQFLKVSLPKFDLLIMTPDVVLEELAGRTLKIYYFAPQEGSLNRGPLTICTSPSLGTFPDNPYRLNWNFNCPRGTSGSPILDLDRNLVVSMGDALLSDEVCTWVKSYDASVKCLVVLAEGGKTYGETAETANWGR